LGVGRHQQIVEVQCAREYEGKGAFPNYIAHGVIDGFEEHAPLKVQGKLWNLKGLQASGKLAGVWTWSRGGGWEGPYIKNELWCDLNTWVMAQWANNPSESEKSIFNRYATTRLGLSAKDAIKFRKLAILSEKAVLRGRRSLAYPTALYRIWTRDEYVSFPRIPQHADTIAVVLKEKDEAIKMWNEIVKLAKQIKFKDKTTTNFVVSSSLYGLEIHRIYRSIIYLAAIKAGLINDSSIKNYIAQYDNAWQNLYLLSDKYPDVCASLYSKSTCRRITEFTTESEPADNMVNFMRNEYINSTMISKPQTSISKQ
jgi:hypothetical protein